MISPLSELSDYIPVPTIKGQILLQFFLPIYAYATHPAKLETLSKQMSVPAVPVGLGYIHSFHKPGVEWRCPELTLAGHRNHNQYRKWLRTIMSDKRDMPQRWAKIFIDEFWMLSTSGRRLAVRKQNPFLSSVKALDLYELW